MANWCNYRRPLAPQYTFSCVNSLYVAWGSSISWGALPGVLALRPVLDISVHNGNIGRAFLEPLPILMCQLDGGWTHASAPFSAAPSEWPRKSLETILLSDVIFLLGWDCWPENDRSRPGRYFCAGSLIVPGIFNWWVLAAEDPAQISHIHIPGTCLSIMLWKIQQEIPSIQSHCLYLGVCFF